MTDLEKANARISELETENVRLREALTLVEWASGKPDNPSCPTKSCDRFRWAKHAQDCPIGLALTQTPLTAQIVRQREVDLAVIEAAGVYFGRPPCIPCDEGIQASVCTCGDYDSEKVVQALAERDEVYGETQ